MLISSSSPGDLRMFSMTIPERGCRHSPSTRSPGPGKWSRQGSCLQQQSKLGHFCALQCHLLSHWVRHGHPQGSLSLLGETLQCTDCVILSLQVCRLQKNYKFTCLQWSPASQLQAGGVSAHLGNGFSVPSHCRTGEGQEGSGRGTKVQVTTHILQCQGSVFGVCR